MTIALPQQHRSRLNKQTNASGRLAQGHRRVPVAAGLSESFPACQTAAMTTTDQCHRLLHRLGFSVGEVAFRTPNGPWECQVDATRGGET